MKVPRRRRPIPLAGKNSQVDAIFGRQQEKTPHRSLWRLGSIVVPAMFGVFFGIAGSSAFFHVSKLAQETQQVQAIDNALVLTQQLDAVFRIVTTGMSQDQVRMETYNDLLSIFRAYDNQFLASSDTGFDTRLAQAYAANRLAFFAADLQDYEAARAYYDRSELLFASLARQEPELNGLRASRFETRLQRIRLEMDSKNFDQAEELYSEAVAEIQQTGNSSSYEYCLAMTPSLRSLIVIGSEMNAYNEAHLVAQVLVESAETLAKKFPDNVEMASDVAYARTLRQKLSDLK